MKIETKFDLKQTVKVEELKVTGRIMSIWIDSKGLTYQVRYFYNGESKKEYFYEDELIIDTKKSEIGIK